MLHPCPLHALFPTEGVPRTQGRPCVPHTIKHVLCAVAQSPVTPAQSTVQVAMVTLTLSH